MHVTLKEQGGIAATVLMQRPPIEVDVNAHGDDAVANVRRLIAASKPATNDRSTPRPSEAMNYLVTVRDGDHETVLRFDDGSLTAEADDLIAWIKQHS